MFVLDTDHLVEFQKGTSDASRRLRDRIAANGDLVVTAIVAVEEQLRGRLADLHRHNTRPYDQIVPYERLVQLLDFASEMTILPWNEDAARIFEELKSQRIRVGTMDLKIASIALSHDATVLTRNLRDFEQVPQLHVEDWLS